MKPSVQKLSDSDTAVTREPAEAVSSHGTVVQDVTVKVLSGLLHNSRTRRHLLVAGLLMMAFLVFVSVVQSVLGWRIKHEIQLVADTLQLEVEMDLPTVQLLRVSPKVGLSGLTVSYPDQTDDALLEGTHLTVELGWLQLLRDFRRIPAIEIHAARLNLQVDATGQNNWQSAISSYWRSKRPDDPVYAVGHIDVRDVEIEYINDAFDQLGSFGISGSVMPDMYAGNTLLSASGDVNYLPATIDLSLSAAPEEDASALLDLAIGFDAIEMHVAARVSQSTGLPDIGGEMTFAGADLPSVLEKLGYGDIAFQQADITTTFDYQEPVLRSGFVKVNAGRSRLSANLVLQHDERHTRLEHVTVAVTSEELYLDEMLSLFGNNVPLEGEILSADSITLPEEGSDRLFSADPFNPPAWLETLEFDADVKIRSLYKGGLYIPSMLLTVSKTGSESLMTVATDHSGEGELRAEMTIDHAQGGASGRLSVSSKQVPLMDFLSLASVPESMASGKLSGSAKLWFDGASAAEIAGSLDGGMFVIVEDGKLDSLLVEMAGIDLMESINLVVRRDLQQTDIRCGFVDLHVQQGFLALEDFIVDTEDSVFIATGSVDLGKELLDLQFTPHPHDASFLAATTSFKVGGNFSKPRVRPGNKLYSRLALATAMAALTGPAAFVLPFIEVGDGGTKSYCSELFVQ